MFNFKSKKIMNYVLAIMMLSTLFVCTGCQTKVVPPGTIVIVLESDGTSQIYTKGSYLAWGRDRIYFVDTKLKSFTEQMKILCNDNINMSVDVKWIGSFNPTKENIKTIKEKVPAKTITTGDITGYQLSLVQFYNTAMKDIIRANTRSVVSKYSTDNIRESREKIQKEISSRVLKRFNSLGYPVTSTDIMVSNLDYPPEITMQRKAIKAAQLENEKQAALARAAIEQAKREAGIAREQGKAQVERARADATANKIRSESLTPQIIQMRQWDVLETIAGKKGDLMIIPYGTIDQTVQAALINKRK
jgi:regulator of protease activity HflC (stomatin/prohibitin superfamily)